MSKAPATETASIGLAHEEAAALREKAAQAGLSASKFVGVLAVRFVEPKHDALLRSWIDAVRVRRKSRTTRTSAVIRSQDMDVIRVAARRVSASPHAWLQAVAIVGSETQQVHNAATERQPPAILDRAFGLVCGTLAAFLADGSKAEPIAAKMRELAGLPPGAILTAEAIRKAALSRYGMGGNVVELRPARLDPAKVYDEAGTFTAETYAKVEPTDAGDGYTVSNGVVRDMVGGNAARIKTFDSVDACKAALMTLKDCQGCVDCVDCVNCMGCVSCGQCRDCTDCTGCIAQVGLTDARGLTTAAN